MADSVNHAPVDPDYSNRRGFDESFIGAEIPLPRVSAGARRLDPGGAASGEWVLPYEHFTVVMSPATSIRYAGGHQMGTAA